MAENNSKETERENPAAESLKPAPVRSKGKEVVPSDPLARYIQIARRVPRLTQDEEHQLALRVWRNKDSEAALKLVTANLNLVVSIAFKFRSQIQNMLDLIQEGNIGLMRAVQKFNPLKGVRLPTYASYWIRAYILKYLLDNWQLVRVGTTNIRRKLLFNLSKVTEQLKASGMDPSPKLLAEHFSTTEADVVAVQKSIGAKDLSLDATIGDGSERTYAEVISDDSQDYDEAIGEQQISEMLKSEVETFSKGLKTSDRTILFDRLMSDEPMTLAEIGEKHGVTREAIRQAETRLMKKLKKHLEEKIPGISDFQFVSQRGRKPVK